MNTMKIKAFFKRNLCSFAYLCFGTGLAYFLIHIFGSAGIGFAALIVLSVYPASFKTVLPVFILSQVLLFSDQTLNKAISYIYFTGVITPFILWGLICEFYFRKKKFFSKDLVYNECGILINTLVFTGGFLYIVINTKYYIAFTLFLVDSLYKFGIL